MASRLWVNASFIVDVSQKCDCKDRSQDGDEFSEHASILIKLKYKSCPRAHNNKRVLY
jgi:hypothetical protein